MRLRVLTAGVVLLGLLAGEQVAAVSIDGGDWLVHFNLPDQNSFWTTGSDDEFAIRDALLGRIDALGAGDRAVLATYTFSGSNVTAGGAAGPIISSVTAALDRGARVSFVADSSVDTGYYFDGTNSLDSLAARPVNSLELSQDDSTYGVQHDKLGVFDYGGTGQWVFVASWNFTGGASTYQWNMALELRGAELHAAYSNEMAELLAGRFHDDPAKSHAHDGTRFAVEGSWSNAWVRFAPYPDESDGGTNAQTDIVRLINAATQEIVFALNKLTRPLIADALVAAADRGVRVHGVIPRSDTEESEDSHDIYVYLTNALNYASSNVVHFVTPYEEADWENPDDGSKGSLVHCKWMVVDPWADHPAVVHGSANWTDAALASDSGNDENVLFLFHRDIARLFYAQFKRMTAYWQGRADSWCAAGRGGEGVLLRLGVTDEHAYRVRRTPYAGSPVVTDVGAFSNRVGYFSLTTNGAAGQGTYFIEREP